MYISKLFAKNFRSLRQVVIRFSPGRNVLVGKNNAGKSNIIKCLDVLLGEKFPTYINFSDDDFYTHDQGGSESIASFFFIEATLEGKNIDEKNIESQKKKTAFSKLKSINRVYHRNQSGEIVIAKDFLLNLDEIESSEHVEVLFTAKNGKEVKTQWTSPEDLTKFLKSSTLVKIFFIKSREEDTSGHGLIIRDENGDYWISHYLTKKVRESLMTTAVIGALRSPKEDLRLVHYSWFGKFIKHIWDKNKEKTHKDGKTYQELITDKTDEIKELADNAFQTDTEAITKLLSKAIYHDKVSFKFLYDGKSDLYKNVKLFVNDGLDRPIHLKGTGIQSALIIALFSQYCNHFHNVSSLLITEEPEIFLHPQARRVISSELDKFLSQSECQERQLIVSSHSTEFLKNVEPFNVVRIDKVKETNESSVSQLTEEISNELDEDFKRLLWSGQTEIFFADKVILVEGGELYLLPALADCIRSDKQVLDYHNISVARINGKGNFLKYIKMLTSFGIDWLVLGDLDCYKDVVGKLVRHLELDMIAKPVEEISSTINGNSPDYQKMKKQSLKNAHKNLDAQTLMRTLQKVRAGEIAHDDEDLIGTLDYIESRYTSKKTFAVIQESGHEKIFTSIQSTLKEHNIFIWGKGELENYYTDLVRSISGSKDIKALKLAYILSDSPGKMEDYIQHIEEVKELVNLIVPEDQIVKPSQVPDSTSNDSNREIQVEALPTQAEPGKARF